MRQHLRANPIGIHAVTIFVLAFIATGTILPAAAAAADAEKKEDRTKQATLDPKKAGPEFELQGEYSGQLETNEGKLPFGVQVISLGDGKFRAVGYPGGLPGEGWNGDDTVSTEGTTSSDTVRFVTDDAIGVVKGGELTISNRDNKSIGALKKVERKSPTLGAKPPADAVVLFDGSTAENFKNGRMTDDKLLMQGCTSKKEFQDCTVHVEFMLSYMPHARGQGRSNSGCYLQGRYEVQILDSFGLDGDDHECGGVYEVRRPTVNMCFPPLTWQTYDIEFTAAKFDEAGKKTASARMTVKHNGVLIQKGLEVPKATRAAPLAEGPTPGPVYLQDHGNPLVFRNIWVVARK